MERWAARGGSAAFELMSCPGRALEFCAGHTPQNEIACPGVIGHKAAFAGARRSSKPRHRRSMQSQV